MPQCMSSSIIGVQAKSAHGIFGASGTLCAPLMPIYSWTAGGASLFPPLPLTSGPARGRHTRVTAINYGRCVCYCHDLGQALQWCWNCDAIRSGGKDGAVHVCVNDCRLIAGCTGELCNSCVDTITGLWSDWADHMFG